MGTNSTFFFQPGEPTRVHPLTPQLNQKLTAEIGKYHAEALDGIGSFITLKKIMTTITTVKEVPFRCQW